MLNHMNRIEDVLRNYFTAFTDETSSSKEQLIAVPTWLGRMERREELKLKVPT